MVISQQNWGHNSQDKPSLQFRDVLINSQETKAGKAALAGFGGWAVLESRGGFAASSASPALTFSIGHCPFFASKNCCAKFMSFWSGTDVQIGSCDVSSGNTNSPRESAVSVSEQSSSHSSQSSPSSSPQVPLPGVNSWALVDFIWKNECFWTHMYTSKKYLCTYIYMYIKYAWTCRWTNVCMQSFKVWNQSVPNICLGDHEPMQESGSMSMYIYIYATWLKTRDGPKD